MDMLQTGHEKLQELSSLLSSCEPEAMADIRGNRSYPTLSGTALFYPFWNGTLVFVYLTGLPARSRPARQSCAPSTSMRAKPAPALRKTPSRMRAPTLIPKTVPIPSMPETCRFCCQTTALHFRFCTRTALPRRRSLAEPPSCI